ncbi:hypothetical protein DPSP01_003107 [Paraphaeosphaeria sporulosa]
MEDRRPYPQALWVMSSFGSVYSPEAVSVRLQRRIAGPDIYVRGGAQDCANTQAAFRRSIRCPHISTLLDNSQCPASYGRNPADPSQTILGTDYYAAERLTKASH